VPDVRVAEDGAGAERVCGGGGVGRREVSRRVGGAIMRPMRRGAGVVLDVKPGKPE